MTMTMERETLASELPVLPAEATAEQLREALEVLTGENLDLHAELDETKHSLRVMILVLDRFLAEAAAEPEVAAEA
jgi:hypothetical protein